MSLTVPDFPRQPAFPVLRPMIGLREILVLVFRQRFKILLALVLPIAASVVLIGVLPKVYRAQSDILVKTGREYLTSGDGEGGAAVGPSSTKQEDINSELSLFNSRAVSQLAIQRIGLDKLYPDLVADPPTGLSLADAAVKRFEEDRSAEPVKMSNIISAAFNASSVEKAQSVLDTLIQVYIDKHTEVFARQRAESYEDSIRVMSGDIDQLERQRTKIKLDNGIFDIAAQRAALITQRVDAETHLQEIGNNKSTLRKRLDYLNSVRPTIPATIQTSNTDKSEEAVHARQSLMDLKQQESAMAARYGGNNPDLQRIRGQMAMLQQSLSSMGNSRTSTGAAPSPLRQQVEQEIVMDNAQLAPLDAEQTRYEALLPRLEGELSRLERADLELRTTTSRVDAMNDNLKALQARYQAARTQEQTALAKQVSVVQIAPAIAPDKPAQPRKIVIFGGGLVAGLLAAGGVILASILTNRTLASEDAAERLLGLPVLVSMPLEGRRSRLRRLGPG